MRVYILCGLLGLVLGYDGRGVQGGHRKVEAAREWFKAAVYDQVPPAEYTGSSPPSRGEAVRMMQQQLEIYEEQARIASENGVDIIVFSEYGLNPRGTNRDTVLPFLESIPAPASHPTPCTDPPTSSPSPTYTLQTLSCIARNHSIYLVANMGDVIYCDASSASCHPTGRLQYNTNVVFDPNGQLVARYHKKNLFFEFKFDTPRTTDYSYFDTPFGRFGTFICFDVLFEEPPIKLVNEFEIDHVLFPTAWMNVYPYFSAVPFHQSFAIGQGVNFLSANLRNPSSRFSGSGIYAANTTINYYNDMNSTSSHLLIGNLPSKPNKIKRLDVKFTPREESVFRDPEFQSDVFGDMYNFVLLQKKQDELMVCQGEICCHLNYEKRDENSNELFALGAFRGLHTREGTYFIEVCAFIKCAGKTPESCGQKVVRSTSYFQSFSLKGNFTTRNVYPQVTTDNVDPSAGQWEYDGQRIVVSNSTEKPFLNAIFFARRYDLDKVGKGILGNVATSNKVSGILALILQIYAFIMMSGIPHRTPFLP